MKGGRIHFIRRVEHKGTLKVLNAAWDVPVLDLLKGVWVTIEFKQTEATLSIYDAAPDVTERQCLITHPFPINEPVLPHPTKAKADQPLSTDHTSQSASDTVRHSSSNSLPLLTPQPISTSGRLLVSFISSAARLVNHIVHTNY